MLVSFIIPLFNCLSLTRECVATLQKSLPAGLEYEIILVDDRSTDGTREWLSTLSDEYRVILNDSNLGYAKSNNRAAQLAQGSLLCLLNNDLIFKDGWWQPMSKIYEQLGERAGAIGNIQRRVADQCIDHSGIRINAKGKPEHDQSWYPWPYRLLEVSAVTGACLLINRNTFLQDGGFDESYLNGGEDVDLCFRLSAKEFINVVALRSTVLHHVSASPGRKMRDETNSYLLASKWRPQLTVLALRPWTRRYLAELWITSIPSAIWKDVVSSLLYLSHFSSRAPRIATTGVEQMMNIEFARWQALFAKE